jgi:hypothetical protein
MRVVGSLFDNCDETAGKFLFSIEIMCFISLVSLFRLLRLDLLLSDDAFQSDTLKLVSSII